MDKIYLLATVCLCWLVVSCHKDEAIPSTPGRWEKISDDFPGNPGRRLPTCYATNDTLVYGLGDSLYIPPVVFNDLWIYTRAGWQQTKKFPGQMRSKAVSFVLGNQIYAGLGSSVQGPEKAYKDLWRYDLATQTWDSLLWEFPGETGTGELLFRSGETIYYGAGIGYENPGNKMYIFTTANGWENANPQFIESQAYSATTPFNGEIYDCFGMGRERDIRKFNAANHQWQTIYTAKEEEEYRAVARSKAKAFAIREKAGDFIYIIGGDPASEEYRESFWKCCRLNLQTQTIEKVNPPDAGNMVAAFTIDNTGYVFNGQSIWKYIP